MRIIAGKLKGLTLHEPKSKDTRPLKDLAKESIFNLLTHSNKISLKLDKSNILDLYAGTGSFGLECLSRESKKVYFVEKNKDALDILKKNIEKLKVEKNVKIFFSEVFKFFEAQKIANLKFDIIFCDPPFKEKNIKKLIELIYNKKLLSKDGITIIHRNKIDNDIFPDFFQKIDERIYGSSKIIFGKFLS